MSDTELLAGAKRHLGIVTSAFDTLLAQKITGAKAYLAGAGVTEAVMASSTGDEAIIRGAIDLWSPDGMGFSPLFIALVTQLQAQSLPETEGGNG